MGPQGDAATSFARLDSVRRKSLFLKVGEKMIRITSVDRTKMPSCMDYKQEKTTQI